MPCGIYKITNKINGHAYIGQLIDIENRWKHHIWESQNQNNQIQYNYPIHQAFRKYGIHNFSFEIIETCPKELLSKKEQFYIQFYNTYKNGYNATLGGETGPSNPGEKNPNAKLTAEDVKTIRQAVLDGKFQKETYEEGHYADKISFRQFIRIWRGEGWDSILPEVRDFVKTKEYLSRVRRHARESQTSMKRAQVVLQDVQERKKKGEARLDVYKKYYSFEYSLSGFNKIWYHE